MSAVARPSATHEDDEPTDMEASMTSKDLVPAKHAVRPTADERLRSERVIINAPMSFAGAAQRAWRIGDTLSGPARVLCVAVVVLPIIALWWEAIVIWYLIFGLWLVPYRLLRRGARKRKQEALRHRETLAALDALRHQQTG
jgi:hypothetical protein